MQNLKSKIFMSFFAPLLAAEAAYLAAVRGRLQPKPQLQQQHFSDFRTSYMAYCEFKSSYFYFFIFLISFCFILNVGVAILHKGKEKGHAGSAGWLVASAAAICAVATQQQKLLLLRTSPTAKVG